MNQRRFSLLAGMATACVAVIYADSYADSTLLGDIAGRLEAVYSNSMHIRVEGQTRSSSLGAVEYVYEGSRESFRTICHSNGSLEGAFSFHNGRVQEFVVGHPRRMLLTYDAENDVSIPRRVYPRELDCLYGHHTTLWIGPHARQATYIAARIREGVLLTREQLGENSCHVVEWSQSWVSPAGEEISNRWRYFIDVDTFVLRRMVAEYRAEMDGEVTGEEVRDFTYSSVQLSEELSDVEWDIWPLVRDEIVVQDRECSIELLDLESE